MKILAINASHRGDRGFTRVCIDKILAGAKDAGATCEVVNLAQLKINRCTGCQACHTEKHFLRCVYDDQDDVKMVFEKMKQADRIIYATPVYLFAMSGLMKTFLDRINSTGDSSSLTLSADGLFFHHIDRSICSKPFVTLVCSDNLEDASSENVVNYFKIYSRFMDARQVGTIIRKSGKLVGHGKEPEREKVFPKIFDVYQALEEAGKELATMGKISARTQKQASAEILPIPALARALMKFKPFRKQALERMQAMSQRWSGSAQHTK